MKLALIAFAGFAPLLAQDIKLDNLSHLAAKAKEKVEVNLEGATLKLASGFMNSSDADQAKVKDLIDGLRGIYVRSFEFERPGEYTKADVEKIRGLVAKAPWQKIVDVSSSKESGENAGIYVKTDGKQFQGLLVIAAEPKELTIVNIVGNIDPARLQDLGGKFGIPNMQFSNGGKKQGPKKDD